MEARASKSEVSRWFENLGGLDHGSFFFSPKIPADNGEFRPPAGTVPLDGGPETLRDTLTGIIVPGFVHSPNLTWFVLAVIVWVIAPYQLEADLQNISWQNVFYERLWVNQILMAVYVGFWHAAVVWWDWAKRPFILATPPQTSRILVNIFFTWLGVFQWTLTESLIVYGYQTQRISFWRFSAKTSLDGSLSGCLLVGQSMAVAILIPAFRDVHFYFTHRLLHVARLFKYIHYLHHTNVTALEPFAGLSMHPLEHMLYFASYGPLMLIPNLHPFLLLWTGTHALLAPAASYSGFEDHFSADLEHFIHHCYPHCNYGIPCSVPFEKWFGTYKACILESSDRIAHLQQKDQSHPLAGYTRDRFGFDLSWIAVWITSIVFSNRLSAWVVTWGIAILPFQVALFGSPRKQALKRIWAPFDKTSVASQIFHLGLGFVLGVLPPAYLIFLQLSYGE